MLRSLLSRLFARGKPGAEPRAAPASAATPVTEARRLLKARAFEQADAAARAVLSEDPENAEALVVRAEVLRRRGALTEAMVAYRRALVANPRLAEAWLDLGVCHYQSGDHFWARVYFLFARKLDPGNADVWNELGLVEIVLGNFETAEQSLEHAVNCNPEHPEAWNNLGLVVARRGDRALARRNFLRATFLKPDFYMAFCNLGLVCRDLEQMDEADRALRRAIELRPEAHTAWLNLGGVLQDEGRLEEALEAFERARRAAPKDVDVLAALSALWLRKGDSAKAIETAEQGLALDPEHADARLALAHAQLANRQFAQGWPNYEARLRGSLSPLGPLPVPLCDGRDLAGKRVLVEREQGLGDEIMFSSCLGELMASGVSCIVRCDRRLAALFQRSFPEVEVISSLADLEPAGGAPQRAIDCALPMGSLPSRFRRTAEDFARARAFLRADASAAARWRERLDALGPGAKVGIAWRGGLYKTGRVMRSLELEELVPVLRTPGARWVNLQHRDHAREIEALRARHGIEITSWDEPLADLDQMAALMQGLDLVITVCSTVVHLAGALGRAVWTLTPHAPAWRYFMQGERMPWYPDVRLFRQHAEGEWDGVIESLAQALRSRLDRAG